MNRISVSIFVLLFVVIASGTTWYLISSRHQALSPAVPTASTTASLAGSSIYTSGTYGFIILYPETVTAEDDFITQYHLSNSWRANALPTAIGTPIVALITYDTKSDHSYPRYYTTQVRIGASSDKREITNCLKVTEGSGETALPDAQFGKTVWKAFSFQSAGMMQYAKGVSYRTIHDGKCVAMEKIATGSNYREDPKSAEDIEESELEKHYLSLDNIVSSFQFAAP